MTSIYLVRHAQALGNVEGRFQGRTDHPLTELGRIQARFVARRFKALPVHCVYASPLQRARATAREITAMLGQALYVEPELIEINGGDLEDKLFDDLRTTYPEQFLSFIEDPPGYTPVGGGESYKDVYVRVGPLLDRLVEQHQGQVLVLVTHGCTLRCMLSHALGGSPADIRDIPWVGNTSVSHILYPDRGSPRIPYIGDTSHLPESKIT